MKIGTFAPVNGKIENVKIMRPAQAILLELTFAEPSSMEVLKSATCKLLVTRQNSENGQTDTIIPFIPLGKLAEIATFNEGAVRLSIYKAFIPVMLSPAGNIQLDSNKYLELSLHDMNIVPDPTEVTIYAIEDSSMSAFITKYQKFNLPAGVSRQSVNLKDADILCLPQTGFDEIKIVSKNGHVNSMTKTELLYKQATKNDITAYRLADTGLLTNTVGSADLFPVGNSFILNLIDVESIEVVRDSDSTEVFEFITADLVK